MALIGQVVSEKKIFENGERRRQMPQDAYTIGLPCEPNDPGEQKALLMIRHVSETDAFKAKLHTNTEIRSYNDLFEKMLELP